MVIVVYLWCNCGGDSRFVSVNVVIVVCLWCGSVVVVDWWVCGGSVSVMIVVCLWCNCGDGSGVCVCGGSDDGGWQAAGVCGRR